ncbi:hypothetical protein CYLTODRAFT_485850 [Cylindrobasidium torrendii FP15055 ss-10]|uniref:DUF1746 domain-containing protein n=1 Tax=Cylindrobasidium torrendii FP15055 ss-10 TaxID=1314674 RepID=A0A0D7BRT8_9AGAR|nr:hypothetical protein CYLTODRAFT_485850 [Cylindrobasidium torrendii FP15055 ss-10]
MHKRYYAQQRKHIMSSLDSLLYQLHVIAFFVSPSIWLLILRCLCQGQCARAREIDPERTLRFYFVIILLFNGYGLWTHATAGASHGRSIILDFVGMPYAPSKLQLLAVDFTIICLQMLLTAIAFENTLPGEDTTQTHEDGAKAPDPPFVINLTFQRVLQRLRESSIPASLAPERDSALPLPNTTPWGLSVAIMRARQARRQAAAMANTLNAGTGAAGNQTVPGGFQSS